MPIRPDYEESFLEYLLVLSDEALFSTTRDYVWMAKEQGFREFAWKRDACRVECERRGKLEIWERAEREALR